MEHVLLSVLALIIIHVVGKAIYNVTLHPLAKIRGPWLRSMFSFPGIWGKLMGRYVRDVNAIHQKYGPVVRISPDAVSFATAEAWKDIYGLQAGKLQLQKDYKRFPDRPEPIHLFGSSSEDHARIRRILNHAFSSAALREQQKIVDKHINKLVAQLSERTGEKLDINHWITMLSFDILSHLTFGESFDSVSAGKTHDFTEDFYQKMSIFPIICASREYSFTNWLMKLMLKIPFIAAAELEFFHVTKGRVDKRMSKDFPDQHDFMKYIIGANTDKGMSHNEIISITTVLMNAGSQDIAVVLSSIVFYLLKNTRCYLRASEDIAAGESNAYLMAAINEALRLRPPGAGNFQRRTGKTGHMVNGYHIPPDTSVGVNQGAEKFKDDNKAVYQPFSIGPRGCLDKALALMAANHTMTALLKNFDMELYPGMESWDENQSYDMGWGRPPLYVMLRAK
ncbi:cytochrome P450 [Byssothecium circinans]|uniref:Cytochrome P450 n=1 Tax=Byssothecium circinans TaxID=147558 RepID=A0A6A5TMQ2_9PLEO|nr:cytochrome P450 [Byssothecium circinans]